MLSAGEACLARLFAGDGFRTERAESGAHECRLHRDQLQGRYDPGAGRRRRPGARRRAGLPGAAGVIALPAGTQIWLAAGNVWIGGPG